VDWHAEDRDGWVADAEKWIAQIKGVLQCKVDLAPDGEVTGVHVVATSDREPRHIVRDVEGLFKARLGMSVFYKKIGVVQVMENGEEDAEAAPPSAAEPAAASADTVRLAEAAVAAASADLDIPDSSDSHDPYLLAEELGPRLLCNGVGVLSTENLLRAEVDLQAAGSESSGTAEGVNRGGNDLRLVAAATLDAVGALVDEPVEFHLVELRTERIGAGEIILVAVEMVQGRRSETLYGTCQPGPNVHQAVVYAVLDALNRRLEMMLFRSAAGAE
jgi:hypothetical protein